MISTCLIGRVKKTQSTPQEEVLSLRKEAGVVQSPPNLRLASYPHRPEGEPADGKRDGLRAVREADHEKMDGWEIDGVRKHTYNLELACKLMGEAEEEAPRSYRISHTSAVYLEGQSPSFFPLLALFTHWLLVTQKGLEGSKLHLGGDRAGGGEGLTVKDSGQKEDSWAQSPYWHRRNKNLQPVYWHRCCAWLWNLLLKGGKKVDPRLASCGSTFLS